jgi:peptidyl-tRNA hydrolase
MEDHNSPIVIAERINQEDPLVMYLIVRESLGMTPGKMCAQCAHASQMILLKCINDGRDWERAHNDDWVEQIVPERFNRFYQWLDSSFRKVTLTADDKEWNKVKAELPADDIVMVVDAGLTQIPSGSETVIAVWPMYRSARPKILRKLQALK